MDNISLNKMIRKVPDDLMKFDSLNDLYDMVLAACEITKDDAEGKINDYHAFNVKRTEKWKAYFTLFSAEEVKDFVKLRIQRGLDVPDSFPYSPIFSKTIQILSEKKKTESILDIGSGLGQLSRSLFEQLNPERMDAVEIHHQAVEIQKLCNILFDLSIHVIDEDFLTTNPLNTYDLVTGEIPLGVRASKKVEFDINGQWVSYRFQEWAFILKGLQSVSEDGQMIVLVAPAILFSRHDIDCRKYLVDHRKIKQIIHLPGGTIPYITIPPVVLVLGKNENDYVDMLDLSEYTISKTKKKNEKELLIQLKEQCEQVDKYGTRIPFEMIESDQYNLDPSRYIKNLALKKFENTVKVEEVSEILRGCQAKTEDYDEGNVYILKRNDIIDHELVLKDLEKVKFDKRFKKYFLCEKDIVIFTKGPSVEVAFVRELKNKKVIASNNCIVIRINCEKAEPEYVMSYLLSKDGMLRLASISNGAVIKNISTTDLKKMEIPYIPIEKQEVLGARYRIMQEKICEQRMKLESYQKKQTDLFENAGDTLGIQ